MCVVFVLMCKVGRDLNGPWIKGAVGDNAAGLLVSYIYWSVTGAVIASVLLGSRFQM